MMHPCLLKAPSTRAAVGNKDKRNLFLSFSIIEHSFKTAGNWNIDWIPEIYELCLFFQGNRTFSVYKDYGIWICALWTSISYLFFIQVRIRFFLPSFVSPDCSKSDRFFEKFSFHPNFNCWQSFRNTDFLSCEQFCFEPFQNSNAHIMAGT